MKKYIYDLEQGDRFIYGGTTYEKGRERKSNMHGTFYMCRPIDCDEIASRPFSGNLEVEVCTSK